jgi:hypothetical protein
MTGLAESTAAGGVPHDSFDRGAVWDQDGPTVSSTYCLSDEEADGVPFLHLAGANRLPQTDTDRRSRDQHHGFFGYDSRCDRNRRRFLGLCDGGTE